MFGYSLIRVYEWVFFAAYTDSIRTIAFCPPKKRVSSAIGIAHSKELLKRDVSAVIEKRSNAANSQDKTMPLFSHSHPKNDHETAKWKKWALRELPVHSHLFAISFVSLQFLSAISAILDETTDADVPHTAYKVTMIMKMTHCIL